LNRVRRNTAAIHREQRLFDKQMWGLLATDTAEVVFVNFGDGSRFCTAHEAVPCVVERASGELAWNPCRWIAGGGFRVRETGR